MDPSRGFERGLRLGGTDDGELSTKVATYPHFSPPLSTGYGENAFLTSYLSRFCCFFSDTVGCLKVAKPPGIWYYLEQVFSSC
jgi:hypothetical protein